MPTRCWRNAGRAFPYVAYGDMLDYLEAQVAAWRQNPNLDLPALNHSRYSRRALTERLTKLIRPR